MNDEDKKLLTNFIGEKWHEDSGIKGNEQGTTNLCTCGEYFATSSHFAQCGHRTFLTGDDMLALKNKIVKKGKWTQFFMWAWDLSDCDFIDGSTTSQYTDWLFTMPRFAELVARAIREGVI